MTVVAVGAVFSLGARVSLTISDITFNDPESCPDPSVFTGWFTTAAAGAAQGAGAGASVVKLGRAYSEPGAGVEIGLDYSVSGTIGRSRVVEKILKCPCN